MGGKSSKAKSPCASKSSSSNALNELAHVAEEVKIESIVKCAYGTGAVEEFRPKDEVYVVRLSNWVLAYSCPVLCYLQREQITLLESPKPVYKNGTIVKTQYGVGKVELYRKEDAMYRVRLSNWVLAYNSTVCCYLQYNDLELVEKENSKDINTKEVESVGTSSVEVEVTETEEAPAVGKFTKGETVFTQFGVGEICEVRKSDYVVRLRKWVLAYECAPKLYLAESALSKEQDGNPTVRGGDNCTSPYGAGVCLSSVGEKLIIEASNWELAYGQIPRFYMQRSGVVKVA